MFALLPLGMKVLERIQGIIDEEMQAISAFKCSLPSLQPAALWASTGRLAAMQDSMYVLADGDPAGSLVLAPTHEEEVTRLVAQHVTSAGRLPLRLYQIGPKFRREQRPRAGLLRLREFIMKDMYSFDRSLEEARATYEETRQAYRQIFERIGIPVVRAAASCGDMGGSLSHEYHLLSDAGEDLVLQCNNCGSAFNEEVCSDAKCSSCGAGSLESKTGIELGHTFLLGTRYTSALGAHFKDTQGQAKAMEMGCYGIGVSRLVAAIAEICHDERGLAWPRTVAPYALTITGGQVMTQEGVNDLEDVRRRIVGFRPALRGRIALDDRMGLSLGWRLKDSALIGIPLTLVLGRDYANGLVELHSRDNAKHQLVSVVDAMQDALESCI